MTRKVVLAILLVLLVAGGLGGIKAMQIRKLLAAAKAFKQPPETISSVTAHEEKWQTSLTAIGSVITAQGVTITPEIAGTISEILFESGAVVKKDDLLLTLDTSTERARLESVQAQVRLAELNFERSSKLRTENMVSQAELDAAEATLRQYRGNADEIRATIGKKTIRAPFNGRLGIRQVNDGQYLEAGKPIVSLQSLSPIYSEFSLPQQELASLKTGMPVRLTIDAFPGKRFDGSLTAINPDLNQSTRSVLLQATFENPDQLLRPGMFARVEVILPEEKNVLVIPATAVLSDPYGDSVYLIESDTNGTGGLVVKQKFVVTGRNRGDLLAVEKGLNAGDRVVSAGMLKLRSGMSVLENNAVTPKSEANPRPNNS